MIGDYSRRGKRRRRQATVNAAKAGGQIDEDDVRRIVGRLQEIGVDPEAQRYAMTELQKPMETEELMAAAQGRPELGAQMYGASLLAIEVDTPVEKKYLERLAAGLGLDAKVTQRIHGFVGLQPA